jgi:hypothetical protein
MHPAQTFSWTASQAETRVRAYHLFLGFCLIVDVLVGLFTIAAPDSVARLLMEPEPFPTMWIRICGILLLGTSFLVFPGWRNPTFYRWPNWAGMAFRLLMMLAFFLEGGVFLFFALWELASPTLLFVTYYRLTLADFGRHP